MALHGFSKKFLKSLKRTEQGGTVTAAKTFQLAQSVKVFLKQPLLFFVVIRLYVNSWKGVVLTVQVDVVRFTPVAPQRRLVQAGAANLDGVVQSGLQIQRRPGLSRCGHHLETAERERESQQTHKHTQIKLTSGSLGVFECDNRD